MDTTTTPPLPSHAALTAVPRRRNGRQQACEPCRKRKLACDHALPTCARCRKRNAEGACVYLIQPPGGGGPGSPSHHRPRVSFSSAPSPRHHRAGSLSSQAARRVLTPPDSSGLNLATRDIEPGASAAAAVSPPPSTDSPGYLGPTSFSAVFRETRDHLSQPPDGRDEQQQRGVQAARPSHSPDAYGMGAATSPHISARIDQGLRILQDLPRPELGRQLFARNVSPMDGWVRPAIGHIMETMWATFGDCLGLCSTAGLRAMAEILCTNTSTPLDEDVDEPSEWLASFSGRNLRWEALGIVFTTFAFGAMEYSGAEYPATSNLHGVVVTDPRKATLLYKDAAVRCAAMCRGEQANSLLLCLYYKNTVIESMVSGDASPQCAMLCAETVAMCTYLGLHVDPAGEHNPDKVTASLEARRRLCWSVFIIDKATSVCTGRPPLFCRRYISTRTPLDVTNDELMTSHAGLVQAARTNHDGNGWSLSGQMSPTTYSRARVNMTLIRDEILEISLSQGRYDASKSNQEQLERLLDMEVKWYASIPAMLRYKPSDLKDDAVDVTLLFAKMMLLLEHLQNIFLLERLLTKSGRPCRREQRSSQRPPECSLLAASVQIVTVTLGLWTYRDRLAGQHRDFEWILISFAAPASGVLCMELLKPSHPTTTDPTTSRSNIIQQLSLLVGFLDWIGPSAPNAKLCLAVKETIQRVLGQVLNEPAPAPAVLTGSGEGERGVGRDGEEGHGGANGSANGAQGVLLQDLDFTTTDITEFFNFNLLDTFDFLRPDGG